MLNVLRFIFLPIGTYIFRLMVKRKGDIFLLITVQRKCKRAQSQACLNYAECSQPSQREKGLGESVGALFKGEGTEKVPIFKD